MIAEMKPSIWVRHDYISKNRDVTKVIQNLTVEARIILGILWSVSAPEISVMASAISRDTNYTSSLLRVLVNSKELAVLEALRGEFPLEATASLIPHSAKVRCKRCHQRIETVPCCKCLIDTKTGLPVYDKSEREPPLPESPETTSHLPGTPGKIQVMRWRLQQNYALFSPGDPSYLGYFISSDGSVREKSWV